MVHNAEPLHRINAEIFGPAPAPIARVRGRHRVRILIKASKGVLIQPALTAWYASIELPTNVRVRIDIDPQTFY
jgi:primosomal protein N' (replication factor Y)